jgi:hypothetical protein
VNPEVALCRHLASLEAGGAAFTLAPDEILDWDDGPVAAIARCAVCGAPAWLEAVDGSRDRSVRVLALAGLRASDVSVFRRNAGKGSCDPKRGAAEREALAAAAGPFERLVAWHLRDERVLAAAPLAPPERVPAGAWPARLPAADDPRWFARLGLDKAKPL